MAEKEPNVSDKSAILCRPLEQLVCRNVIGSQRERRLSFIKMLLTAC